MRGKDRSLSLSRPGWRLVPSRLFPAAGECLAAASHCCCVCSMGQAGRVGRRFRNPPVLSPGRPATAVPRCVSDAAGLRSRRPGGRDGSSEAAVLGCFPEVFLPPCTCPVARGGQQKGTVGMLRLWPDACGEPQRSESWGSALRETPRRARDSGFCGGGLGTQPQALGSTEESLEPSLPRGTCRGGRVGCRLSRSIRFTVVLLLGLSAKTRITKEERS